MEKIITWENAQAQSQTFTIIAYASGLDEARRLVISEMASLVPQTLSPAAGAALMNWTYENEPVVKQSSSRIAEQHVSIAKVNEQ
jgi:hypothetical protein